MYQFEADKFYPSPSNFFKMVRTIFGGIIFQDFAAPSFQNDAFDLQTGRSSLPVLCLFVCLFVYFTTHVTKKQNKSTKKYILQTKWRGSLRRNQRAYRIRLPHYRVVTYNV